MSYTLIDTIRVVSSGAGQGEVNGPVTSVTFGAAGDGFAQAAIDGTNRKEYQIRGIVRAVQNSLSLSVRPNNDTADSFMIGINGAATVSAFSLTELHILGGGLTQPITAMFEFNFWSEDGVIRPYLSFAGGREDGTSTALNDYRIRTNGGSYEGTATVLSSLVVVGSPASGIGANSYFRLYEIEGQLT